MKNVSLLLLIITSYTATATSTPVTHIDNFAPNASISMDYINADKGLYGVTIGINSYDRDYARWGYYFNYATNKKQTIAVPEPASSYSKQEIKTFGLTYRLTNQLSTYAGYSYYIESEHYTNGIMPLIEGGEPEWEVNANKRKRAEYGLRLALGTNLQLALGYNAAIQATTFSIGFIQ